MCDKKNIEADELIKLMQEQNQIYKKLIKEKEEAIDTKTISMDEKLNELNQSEQE